MALHAMQRMVLYGILLRCCAARLQERVASSEIVSTWAENGRCPYITEVKTIVHPGEVRTVTEQQCWLQGDAATCGMG